MDHKDMNEWFSPEHLDMCAYFAMPEFDDICPQIGEVMKVFPNELNRDLISVAAEKMHEAKMEGVKLSATDAMRLARCFKPTPIEELIKRHGSSESMDAGDYLSLIDKAEEQYKEKTPAGVPSLSAVKKAKELKTYADMLAKNEDIILLGIPVFWPEMDSAWVKLAFLGGEITETEQAVLNAMKECADESQLKMNEGILTAVFMIINIHEEEE